MACFPKSFKVCLFRETEFKGISLSLGNKRKEDTLKNGSQSVLVIFDFNWKNKHSQNIFCVSQKFWNDMRVRT